MSTILQQTNLAFERRGAGVPIVLLPGLTFARGAWRPIVDRLGEQVCRAAAEEWGLSLNVLRLTWPTPDDVWRPSPYNVPELHERVVREILTGVNRARREENANPLGVAMQGRAGSGNGEARSVCWAVF